MTSHAMAAMTALACALTQGPGPRMGRRGGRGPDSGSMIQMQGMMQQMGGMIRDYTVKELYLCAAATLPIAVEGHGAPCPSGLR